MSGASGAEVAMRALPAADGREVVFWGSGDDVELAHDDIDDAIAWKLDGIADRHLPRTVEIVGYARMRVVVAGRLEEDVLDHVLEALDGEYGDPDADEATIATPAMEHAARLFVDTVAGWYRPWMCEPVVHVTIDVASWVLEHRPDWLGDEPDLLSELISP